MSDLSEMQNVEGVFSFLSKGPFEKLLVEYVTLMSNLFRKEAAGQSMGRVIVDLERNKLNWVSEIINLGQVSDTAFLWYQPDLKPDQVPGWFQRFHEIVKQFEIAQDKKQKQQTELQDNATSIEAFWGGFVKKINIRKPWILLGQCLIDIHHIEIAQNL